MSEYWIFLIPTASQSKKYKMIINLLSNKYNTPDIELHLTVLGPLKTEENDLVNKVKMIAKKCNKLEVEILGINFSNTISQCVFAQIKMSPQLLNLYTELKTDLHDPDKSPYFPHLSLIYGDFTPAEKANIASQVKLDNTLILDKLVIFRDGPSPNEWTKVIEFELN